MAAPTASTLTSYGLGWPLTIGSGGSAATTNQRENLMDEITLIDPTDVPTWQMLAKVQVDGPYVEWQIDSLAATATAGTYEGWEFDLTALSGRTRLSNVVQYFATGFQVTRAEQLMSQRGLTAGVGGNEYRYQLGKKLKELARNMDARLVAVGTAVASASGASGTAPRMASLRAWADGSYPAISTTVSGAFATGSFLNLRAAMDKAGADPDTLLVSTGVKADVSILALGLNATATNTSLRRFVQDASSKTLGGVIEIIEDDFGQIMIVRDRWMNQASATAATTANAPFYLLFDRAKVQVGIFDAPHHTPLPPNGNHERGFIAAAITCKVAHPSALGFGHNVTTQIGN